MSPEDKALLEAAMTEAKNASFDAVAAEVCNKYGCDVFVSGGTVYGRTLTPSMVKQYAGR